MKEIKVHKNLGRPSRRSAWLKRRAKLITSSEVGAVFDQSPYLTPLELFGRKSGLLDDDFVENSRMKAGRMLEPSVAAWAADELGAKAKPFRDFYEDTEARLGASFDWQIAGMEGKDGPGILEVKCVDYIAFNGSFKEGYTDRKWHPVPDSEDFRAPIHIELQVQMQLLLTGWKWAVIAVLVAGNELKLLHREANPIIQQKIRDACARFWSLVDADEAPEADYGRDFETLKRLYAVPDPRASIAGDDVERAMNALDIATEAAAQKKAAEAEEKHAKAVLMDVMRGADYAILPNGGKVSWKADKNGRRTMRLTAPVPETEVAA